MSRRDGKATFLRHHPSRAVPSTIVGLLLLAVGVALVWVAVERMLNGAWPAFLAGARDWLAGLIWNSPSMWAIGAVTAVAGLVLLLAALIPGPYNALPVTAPEDACAADVAVDGTPEIIITRHSVARLASAHCEQIDGVGSATATASDREVHLNVTTALHETAELRHRIIDGVRDRLAATGLDPTPRITASVRSRD